jgi:hypothetical protein
MLMRIRDFLRGDVAVPVDTQATAYGGTFREGEATRAFRVKRSSLWNARVFLPTSLRFRALGEERWLRLGAAVWPTFPG